MMKEKIEVIPTVNEIKGDFTYPERKAKVLERKAISVM